MSTGGIPNYLFECFRALFSGRLAEATINLGWHWLKQEHLEKLEGDNGNRSDYPWVSELYIQLRHSEIISSVLWAVVCPSFMWYPHRIEWLHPIFYCTDMICANQPGGYLHVGVSTMEKEKHVNHGEWRWGSTNFMDNSSNQHFTHRVSYCTGAGVARSFYCTGLRCRRHVQMASGELSCLRNGV